MAKKRNIIVGQSGGPTAVINSSLAGVYKNAIERGFDKVYGMLHGIQGLLDEQYIDLDAYDPHYFLNFNFDPDGNFVNAQLQVNLFRDNEINITESIASLDAEEINAEIQKEYQRAIG